MGWIVVGGIWFAIVIYGVTHEKRQAQREAAMWRKRSRINNHHWTNALMDRDDHARSTFQIQKIMNPSQEVLKN